MNFSKTPGVMLVGVLVGPLVLGGCNTSINSSIVVPDGESRSGAMTTVNGDVSIGRDCTIEGTSRSVNGWIEGDIVVKRDVDVRVILSDGGKVLGQVDDAEVIDKNGAQPVVGDD